MTNSLRSAVALSLLTWIGTVQAAGADPDSAFSQHGPGTACLGGVGGVYLLAEPGELTIDVFKRDRNRRGSTTELRAILAGPDRRVIAESIIPDDGQPRGSGLGPVRQTRLVTHVQRKGVYALNISVSQDRYGEEMLWGFAGLSDIAAAHGQFERSAILWGAAHAVADLTHRPITGIDGGSLATRIADVLAELGQSAFAALVAKGRALTLDRAVEYALSEDS